MLNFEIKYNYFWKLSAINWISNHLHIWVSLIKRAGQKFQLKILLKLWLCSTRSKILDPFLSTIMIRFPYNLAIWNKFQVNFRKDRIWREKPSSCHFSMLEPDTNRKKEKNCKTACSSQCYNWITVRSSFFTQTALMRSAHYWFILSLALSYFDTELQPHFVSLLVKTLVFNVVCVHPLRFSTL